MSDDKRITKALKTIALWSNRANDAYAMGEADWAHAANGNYLTSVASYSLKHRGTGPDGWETAAYAVEHEAKMRGIDSKRHRLHAR